MNLTLADMQLGSKQMDEKTEGAFEYLAQRLTEPSTWVSLGVMATGLGFGIAPDHWQSIAMVGMGLGGLAGTLLRERKKTTSTDIVNVVRRKRSSMPALRFIWNILAKRDSATCHTPVDSAPSCCHSRAGQALRSLKRSA